MFIRNNKEKTVQFEANNMEGTEKKCADSLSMRLKNINHKKIQELNEIFKDLYRHLYDQLPEWLDRPKVMNELTGGAKIFELLEKAYGLGENHRKDTGETEHSKLKSKD